MDMQPLHMIKMRSEIIIVLILTAVIVPLCTSQSGLVFVVNRFKNVSFKCFSLCISSHLCREPYGTVFDPGFHLTFKFDRKLLLVDLRI
ncbi:hypothetical protein PO909_014766 [Leuciscus waleckii]